MFKNSQLCVMRNRKFEETRKEQEEDARIGNTSQEEELQAKFTCKQDEGEEDVLALTSKPPPLKRSHRLF